MSSSSQPYLPMTFSELKSLLEMDNIVEWPTYRFRLLGEFQVSQEDDGTKTYFLKNHPVDVVISEETRGKLFLLLDFTLNPEMAYKYEQGRIIQIMGEMTSTPDKRAMLQVHIICDFDGVNVERYLKAISKQSLVCPRMSFRRLILDTALSPAPNVFLPSVPRAKHDEVLSKDISMDLFESDEEPPEKVAFTLP